MESKEELSTTVGADS